MSYKKRENQSIRRFLTRTYDNILFDYDKKVFGFTAKQLSYIMECDVSSVLYQMRAYCKRNQIQFIKKPVTTYRGTFDCYIFMGYDAYELLAQLYKSRMSKDCKLNLITFIEHNEEYFDIYSDNYASIADAAAQPYKSGANVPHN